MKIALGSDHAGYRLKVTVSDWLHQWGYEVEDFGCHDASQVDYPDIAVPVAEAVARGACDLAVLVCGSGAGMAVTANKVRGVRAVVAHDVFTAHQAREHLDAQVLCLGERIIGPGLARDILHAYLSAGFEGGRHARRVDKIAALEAAQGAAERSR